MKHFSNSGTRLPHVERLMASNLIYFSVPVVLCPLCPVTPYISRTLRKRMRIICRDLMNHWPAGKSRSCLSVEKKRQKSVSLVARP